MCSGSRDIENLSLKSVNVKLGRYIGLTLLLELIMSSTLIFSRGRYVQHKAICSESTFSMFKDIHLLVITGAGSPKKHKTKKTFRLLRNDKSHLKQIYIVYL